jgi:hypothetical protein
MNLMIITAGDGANSAASTAADQVAINFLARKWIQSIVRSVFWQL